MLSDLRATSIGFKFVASTPLIMIKGIGWQNNKDSNYIWDNRNRRGEYCLFQYTLSGEGEIEIEGEVHRLKTGDAFVIEIPGEHCYRLPSNSSFWEVVYIEFSKEAVPFFHKIYNLKGNIFSVDKNSYFIKLMWNFYKDAMTDNIQNVYQCSSYAYQLVMELINEFYQEQKDKSTDSKIENCKKYIDKNYNKPITLDEISSEVHLSKYYLTRKFQEQIGLTPGNYIMKTRLKKSMELLLLANDMGIDTVAREVGFSCGNYFSKVFKKNIGVSPGEFRNNNNNYEVNRIIFDNNYKNY